jgi:WD40 repeat protein
LVVAASNIGFLVEFDMSAQMESDVITGPFTRTYDGLTDVSLSPDSTRIATTGSDGIVRIWNATTDELENTIDANVRVNDVAWSPDGESIVYAGDEGIVKIVSVEPDTDAGS